MTKQNWLEYKVQIKDRLKIFALKILQLSEMLRNQKGG